MTAATTTRTTCPRCHGTDARTSRGVKVCRTDGTRMHTTTGVYGVVKWRGDGRYRLADALATYSSEAAAGRRADKLTSQYGYGAGGHVVRWFITESEA